MKLFLIDLDGVVADSTARFEQAKRPDESIDWSVAFNPDLVDLDKPIAGAKEAVEALEAEPGQIIMFLTSRPEPMRAATLAWLAKHGFPSADSGLICKPLKDRFVKTVTWKANVTERLAELFDEVIFIDDEGGNRMAVESLGIGIVCRASLVE